MPYESDQCACDQPTITRCQNERHPCLPYRCKGCRYTSPEAPAGAYSEARQRRIWNASRVPSSLFMATLSALTLTGGPANAPLMRYQGVNWNQASDRNRPAGSDSSTAAALPARAQGVDVKHNSYARRLGRLKAANIKTSAEKAARLGNKRRALSVVQGVVCGCPTRGPMTG